MSTTEFTSGRNLGEEIKGMSRGELCDLVIELCRLIRDEGFLREYRGGVYPENISRDEEGRLVLGEGAQGGWGEEELKFIAPELYWNGESSPASDVYSLGLLLCYGLNGGKLPFAGESSNAQLSRMSGRAIQPPAAAGPRLGEIIGKAVAFREGDRYQSVDELAVMLESCRDNKYLDGEDGARSLFRKEDEDLSDMEKLMMSIISGDEQSAPPETEEEEPREELSAEEAMAEILDTAPEKPAEPLEPTEPSVEELVSAFFSNRLSNDGAPAPEEEESENDDVRVYEPGQERRDRQPIPILTEEKNPELAPVVPRHLPRRSVQYSSDPERSRQIGDEVRKRRKRPLLVILVLCVLLLALAAVVNYVLRGSDRRPDPSIGTMTVNTPTPGENAPQLGENGTGSIVTPMPDPLIGQQGVRYEVLVDDASWIEAKAKAESIGGHLAVITSPQELEKVAAAIAEAGLARAWIGCHRLDDQFVWETDEYVSYYPWDENEPSGVDAYDNAPEDFVMLWNRNGWSYIDCRNDPARDFPAYYSGSIGYVVEYGVGE